MPRPDYADLSIFVAVADERSFTRAAAQLGTSQSAVSHAMRRLEAQLGIKLLSRTTRSVSVTEAGEHLLETLRPAFGTIGARLEDMTKLRKEPAGLVRITCSRHAARTVLWPVMNRVMARYPEIRIELSMDGTLTNIVSERFDAGVRLGEQVDKDMVALRIGPDIRLALVASPAYLALNPAPDSPRDLTRHDCINLRLATKGDLYVWEFEKDGREINVRVDGRLTVNDSFVAVDAALAGHGVAFVLEDEVLDHVTSGALIRLLVDWCPPFAGHHLYYPDRYDLPPAFSIVLNELRKQADEMQL
jgi:DNA-binding transcriptional LysR family regulator